MVFIIRQMCEFSTYSKQIHTGGSWQIGERSYASVFFVLRVSCIFQLIKLLHILVLMKRQFSLGFCLFSISSASVALCVFAVGL